MQPQAREEPEDKPIARGDQPSMSSAMPRTQSSTSAVQGHRTASVAELREQLTALGLENVIAAGGRRAPKKAEPAPPRQAPVPIPEANDEPEDELEAFLRAQRADEAKAKAIAAALPKAHFAEPVDELEAFLAASAVEPQAARAPSVAKP